MSNPYPNGYPTPPVYYQPQPQQPNWLLIAVIVLAGALAWNMGVFDKFVPDRQEQQQQREERHEEANSKVDWLVCVEETVRPMSRQLVLDALWTVQPKGVSFRRIDPDSSDADEFVEAAKALGVSVPFFLTIDDNADPIEAIPFPDDVKKVGEMFK